MENTKIWLFTAVIGIGATLIVDAWAMLRRHWFATPLPNYALVGRWIGHFSHGQFRHESIARAVPVRGERTLGWLVHYLTGIAFASLLPLVCGMDWLQRPTPSAALAIGTATVVAPLFIMQPAMGAKGAPGRSLAFHAVFGLGLYLSALAVSRL